MPQLVALSLSIAVLGAIWAFLCLGPLSGYLVVWAGFIVTTMLVNNAFCGRKYLLTAIDAGHWLIVLVLMGAVIGAMGV